MRITFEMSGGYGGLFVQKPLSCRVDTNALSDAEREQLTALVQASGLLQLSADELRRKGGPRADVYAYRLSVTERGNTSVFDLDDVTAPPESRPLLQYLQTRAIEERMKGA